MIERRFRDRYFLNGINIYDRWGIIIERGGYAELTRRAQRKEQYSHVWLDENGTQRYVGDTLLDTKTITLPFTFVCDNLEDYLSKSKDFLNYIINEGYFNLYSKTLLSEYKLLYNTVQSVEDKTRMYKNDGVVIATHNVQLVDDFLTEGGVRDYSSVKLLGTFDDNITYQMLDEEFLLIGELN